MDANIRPSSDFKILATLPPHTVAASNNSTSTWFDVRTAGTFWLSAYINLGVLNAGTATVEFLQATANDGTGAKALVGSQTSTTDNAHLFAEAHIDNLDTANGFYFVAMKVSINADATSPALVSGVLLGAGSRNETGPNPSTV